MDQVYFLQDKEKDQTYIRSGHYIEVSHDPDEWIASIGYTGILLVLGYGGVVGVVNLFDKLCHYLFK